jgi:hypothetical protein
MHLARPLTKCSERFGARIRPERPPTVRQLASARPSLSRRARWAVVCRRGPSPPGSRRFRKLARHLRDDERRDRQNKLESELAPNMVCACVCPAGVRVDASERPEVFGNLRVELAAHLKARAHSRAGLSWETAGRDKWRERRHSCPAGPAPRARAGALEACQLDY